MAGMTFGPTSAQSLSNYSWMGQSRNRPTSIPGYPAGAPAIPLTASAGAQTDTLGGIAGAITPPAVTPPPMPGLPTMPQFPGAPAPTAAPAAVPRETIAAAPPREAPMKMADRTAANAARFGQAKDQVGRQSMSALKSMRARLAERGISGTGVEGKLTRDIIEGGYGELGKVRGQQAITDAEMAQRVAELNQQAGISQRGQDLGYAGTVANAGIAQRGQDISQANTTAQMASENALRNWQAATGQYGAELDAAKLAHGAKMDEWRANLEAQRYNAGASMDALKTAAQLAGQFGVRTIGTLPRPSGGGGAGDMNWYRNQQALRGVQQLR